ncbi:hypothetical protein TNCV_2453031 [Trichonephila clavipes]|nr:hypothetical protein TNCV_2453031 [Trichonephila clavipes]
MSRQITEQASASPNFHTKPTACSTYYRRHIWHASAFSARRVSSVTTLTTSLPRRSLGVVCSLKVSGNRFGLGNLIPYLFPISSKERTGFLVICRLDKVFKSNGIVKRFPNLHRPFALSVLRVQWTDPIKKERSGRGMRLSRLHCDGCSATYDTPFKRNVVYGRLNAHAPAARLARRSRSLGRALKVSGVRKGSMFMAEQRTAKSTVGCTIIIITLVGTASGLDSICFYILFL